jgi:hypothetical protein
MTLLQTMAIIALVVGGTTASVWDRTTSGKLDASAIVADTSDAVAVTVEQQTYKPGAIVELRLQNRTNTAYGYNACQRTVQRKDGAQWVNVPEPGMMCTMQIDLLPAKGNATARTQLPDSLRAGEYRLELRLMPQGNEAGGAAAVEAASNAFRVQ